MAKARKKQPEVLDKDSELYLEELPTGVATKRAAKPASNPESRERQLVNLAVNLAEKQLREGTASSQVITHYLKLGTQTVLLEREKLSKEVELISAKADAIKQGKQSEQLAEQAIAAMKAYSPTKDD